MKTKTCSTSSGGGNAHPAPPTHPNRPTDPPLRPRGPKHLEPEKRLLILTGIHFQTCLFAWKDRDTKKNISSTAYPAGRR